MTDHLDLPVVATGDWIDAAWINQYLRDNFTAIFQGLAAGGDIPYAVDANTVGALSLVTGGLLYGGASAPAYLAPSTAGKVLKTNGIGSEWAPMVSSRQGGSSTVWNSPGTTTYVPTSTIIQTGCVSMTFASSTGNFTAITYPTAFTQAPTIFVSPECIFNLSFMWSVGTTQAADPTTGFNLNVKWASAYTGTINFSWLAIGQ